MFSAAHCHDNGKLIRFITLIIIIVFLCQNLAWAQGQKTQSLANSNSNSTSTCLARFSEINNLIPGRSRKEVTDRAAQRLEELDAILDQTAKNLTAEKQGNGKEKEVFTADLREKLAHFYSPERAGEIADLRDADLPEELLTECNTEDTAEYATNIEKFFDGQSKKSLSMHG